MKLIKGFFKLIFYTVMVLIAIYSMMNMLGTDESDQATPVSLRDLETTLVALSYDTLARFPDENKNRSVRFRGRIAQKVNDTSLRVDVTEGEFGFWRDTVYVDLKGAAKETRILEGDIIEFTGRTNGERTYYSVLGARVTIPRITAHYITLLAKVGDY